MYFFLINKYIVDIIHIERGDNMKKELKFVKEYAKPYKKKIIFGIMILFVSSTFV